MFAEKKGSMSMYRRELAFLKTKPFYLMIFCILILFSFFCGFRYAQIEKLLFDKTFILNLRGLELLTVNEQFDLAVQVQSVKQETTTTFIHWHFSDALEN